MTTRTRITGRSKAAPFAATLVATFAILGSAQPGFAQAQSQFTFTKDIAPVIQRACQDCHRPGNIGPMSLLTYQDVRPWARAIRQQVIQRNMPPWYIDRTVGIRKFKNDPSLSQAEIDMISAWVDAGAPQGDPAQMPPPRQFDDSNRWHIGQPMELRPRQEPTFNTNTVLLRRDSLHSPQLSRTPAARKWGG